MKLNFIENNNLKNFIRCINGLEYLPNPNSIKKTLKNELYNIIYAKKNNKIIGGCVWFKKNRRNAHIYILFIKKDFRKKGFAKKIIEYVIKKSEKRGYASISSFVDKSNKNSICAFLQSGFEICAFNFDRNFILLKREKKKEEEYYERLIYDLFLSDDLEVKKGSLEKLLQNPVLSMEVLRKKRGIDKTRLDPANRLKYLKFLADSEEENGVMALKELGNRLNEMCSIAPLSERLKLLKYVAIHSKKEISQKAINMLYHYLGEIVKIKNPELCSSFLRYLAIHLYGKKKNKVLSYLKKVKNSEVKKTSMDYILRHTK